jgi:hypothetical protein
VVRALEPGGPDRLVQLSGSRQRTFTVVTAGAGRDRRAHRKQGHAGLGVWDAFDPVGATAIGASPGMNGLATGESWLRVTVGDDVVRLGIADQRGDGRPDYAYNGWVLYADTVQPQRLPASGGPLSFTAWAFALPTRSWWAASQAVVTSISPNEITAIAPPAATGVTGSVDVEVDDLPIFYAAAVVSGGVSYDSGTGDALTLLTAPMNTVPIGVPIPFTVTALGPESDPGRRRHGHLHRHQRNGHARLRKARLHGHGHRRRPRHHECDGRRYSTWSIVTASLTNGSSLQAQFAGGTPPVLASLTPSSRWPPAPPSPGRSRPWS